MVSFHEFDAIFPLIFASIPDSRIKRKALLMFWISKFKSGLDADIEGHEIIIN